MSQATVRILSSSVPAKITLQPRPFDGLEEDRLVMRIETTGTKTLVYQWLKGGQAIAGQTSESLVIDSVIESDAGSYSVSVTNDAGSAVSESAVVTITKPVAITAQPQGRTSSDRCECVPFGHSDRDGSSSISVDQERSKNNWGYIGDLHGQQRCRV